MGCNGKVEPGVIINDVVVTSVNININLLVLNMVGYVRYVRRNNPLNVKC